jgi:regulator of nucleoside diphosphate kinase
MFGKKHFITRDDYERIINIIKSLDNLADFSVIKNLNRKFKKAKLIDPKEIKSTVITMNSRFRLKNLGNGIKKEFSLVFPKDCDPLKNKISILDKIGAEIISRETGEVICLKNGEESYYLIEDVIYQPEAAGDYHL